jgi:hypothetical protein
MRFAPATFAPDHVHIINASAFHTFIFVVQLHYLYLLCPVLLELCLVLLHQLMRNGQESHLFRGFHADYHVVKIEEGVRQGLQGFDYIAVLLAVEVEGVLGRVFGLQFVDCLSGRVPTSEAMTWRRRPPSWTIF